jgi:hypothetical protein
MKSFGRQLVVSYTNSDETKEVRDFGEKVSQVATETFGLVRQLGRQQLVGWVGGRASGKSVLGLPHSASFRH